MLGLKYFYKECTIYNLVFTGICLGNAILYPDTPIMFFFWTKALGFLFVGTAYLMFQSKTSFFFLNIGLDVKKLLLISFMIDLVLTLSLVLTIKWIY